MKVPDSWHEEFHLKTASKAEAGKGSRKFSARDKQYSREIVAT
jgi:hypothetical protein